MTHLPHRRFGRAARRRARVVLAGGLLVTTAALAVGQSQDPTTQALALSPGSAWFADPRTGDGVLVDGSTASVVARRPIGAPGDDLRVADSDGAALFTNVTTGIVTGVDPTTLVASTGTEYGERGDLGLHAVAAGDAAWVIARHGTVVQQIDVRTAAPLAPAVTAAGDVTSSAVEVDGELFTAGGSGVHAYAPDRADARRVSDLVGSQIVRAGHRVISVSDGPTGTTVVDLGGRRTLAPRCLDLSADARLGGSGGRRTWLLAVDAAIGQLTVLDVETATCSRPLPLFDPDATVIADLGAPVERGGLVFVPERTTGSIVVIDPMGADAGVVTRITVPDAAGHEVSLRSAGGYVWYVDTTSMTVGVVSDELEVTPIDLGEGPSAGVSTGPQRRQVEPCGAEPSIQRVGQPVTLTSPAGHPDVPNQRWRWSVEDGRVEPPAGPQVEATWDSVGTRRVTVTAEVDDAAGPIELVARCTVEIVDELPEAPPETITTEPEGETEGGDEPGESTVPEDPGNGSAGGGSAGAGGGAGGSSAGTFGPIETCADPPDRSKPCIAWTPLRPQVGEPVTFTLQFPERVTGVTWTFAGGSPASSTTTAPSTSFAAAGEHAVTFSADVAGFGRQNWSETIAVVPVPSRRLPNCPSGEVPTTAEPCVTVSTTTPRVGEPVTFSLRGEAATGVTWSFPAGTPTTSSDASARVTWAAAGVHQVTLVADVGGGAVSWDGSITVGHPPFGLIRDCPPGVADLSASVPCVAWTPTVPVVGQPVQFSLHLGRDVVGARWSFDDARTSNEDRLDPAPVWDTPGTHRVDLAVDVVGAGPQPWSTSVVVAPPPITACSDPPVHPCVRRSQSVPYTSETIEFTVELGPYDQLPVRWAFEGGATTAAASSATVTTSWTAVGRKPVTLIIGSGAGTQTWTEGVSVRSAPLNGPLWPSWTSFGEPRWEDADWSFDANGCVSHYSVRPFGSRIFDRSCESFVVGTRRWTYSVLDVETYFGQGVSRVIAVTVSTGSSWPFLVLVATGRGGPPYPPASATHVDLDGDGIAEIVAVSTEVESGVRDLDIIDVSTGTPLVVAHSTVYPTDDLIVRAADRFLPAGVIRCSTIVADTMVMKSRGEWFEFPLGGPVGCLDDGGVFDPGP